MCDSCPKSLVVCRRRKRAGEKDIVLKKKRKIETMLQFSTLKVISTLEVFWLASLFITIDIYFDNYTVELLFK